MIKSSLLDYSDAYVFLKGTLTIIGGPAATYSAGSLADEIINE